MQRFWSKFLTAAILGCLLTMWVLPALAYYPPLKAQAKKKRTEVTFSVKDPEIGFTFDVYYGVHDLVKRNGVLAMIQGFPGDPVNVRVTYATYDPFRKKFVTNISEQQEKYSDISQLKVADGVVAYIGTDPEGNKAFIYATYDPKEGVWRQMKWLPWHANDPAFVVTDMLIFITDAVVVYGYGITSTIGGHPGAWLFRDIYNPIYGNWYTSGEGQDSFETFGEGVDIKNFRIKNATIYYDIVAGIAGAPPYVVSETRGYDAFNDFWDHEPTRPWAHCVAQPSFGLSSPLWVWFTDQSIGDYKVKWSFGDNGKSNKRSTYHKYTSDGTYTATQELMVPLKQQEQLPTPFQLLESKKIHVGPVE
jgi:hypothetical protein